MIVSKPTMESVIDSMHAADDGIGNSKSRFVGKGFSQKKGVDLDEKILQIQDAVRISWFVGERAPQKEGMLDRLIAMSCPTFCLGELSNTRNCRAERAHL